MQIIPYALLKAYINIIQIDWEPLQSPLQCFCLSKERLLDVSGCGTGVSSHRPHRGHGVALIGRLPSSSVGDSNQSD